MAVFYIMWLNLKLAGFILIISGLIGISENKYVVSCEDWGIYCNPAQSWKHSKHFIIWTMVLIMVMDWFNSQFSLWGCNLLIALLCLHVIDPKGSSQKADQKFFQLFFRGASMFQCNLGQEDFESRTKFLVRGHKMWDTQVQVSDISMLYYFYKVEQLQEKNRKANCFMFRALIWNAE